MNEGLPEVPLFKAGRPGMAQHPLSGPAQLSIGDLEPPSPPTCIFPTYGERVTTSGGCRTNASFMLPSQPPQWGQQQGGVHLLPCGMSLREAARAAAALGRDAGLFSDDEAEDLPALMRALHSVPGGGSSAVGDTVSLGTRTPPTNPAAMSQLLSAGGREAAIMADMCALCLEHHPEGASAQDLYRHYQSMQRAGLSGAALEWIQVFGGASEEAVCRDIEAVLSLSHMFECSSSTAGGGERRWRLASDLQAMHPYQLPPQRGPLAGQHPGGQAAGRED